MDKKSPEDGTELWGVRCLWGAGVLSLQSCPVQLCVYVCVSTHTDTHTHTQIFFLGFNWHLLWIQERGRIFENNYFSLQNSYSGLREPDCSLSQQVLEKMVANMRRPMKWQKHDSECFYSLSYGMRLGDTQQCLPAFRNSGWEGWFGGQQVGVPSIACLV